MRWTLVRAICILIFCLLAASAAVFIGVHKPLSNNIALLHLSDCQLPCWIGITPQVTTFRDAKQRVHDVYDREPGISLKNTNPVSSNISASYQMMNLDDRQEITITLYAFGGTEDSPIDQVIFGTLGQNTPRLGDIFLSLPAPQALQLGRNWFMVYPTWTMQGGPIENNCHNYTTIGVSDYVGFFNLTSTSNPAYTLNGEVWHGFRSCYY